MTQHTSGPWRIDSFHTTSRINAGNWQFMITNSKGAPMDEWQANGRLIAAAPDLLAALKEARDWVAQFPNERTGLVVDSIDDAIAKATGEETVVRESTVLSESVRGMENK